MVLKMDFARRNSALLREIILDTVGEVPVNNFKPLIL